MQRYFGISKNKNEIKLNHIDFNHIKNVMRFKENDKVCVVFENKVYLCSLNKDLESVTIIKETQYEEDNYNIRMYVPLLPNEKIDFILQKCTEIGVKEFYIINTSRCKFKINNEKIDKKIERWTKICKEASEQSERNYIPLVKGILELKDIEANGNINIVCSLDKDNSKTIKTAFKNRNKFDIINIVFGPEGGLSNIEEELLIKNGFTPVNFGKQVLRTETTPIFISSIIKYMYMED